MKILRDLCFNHNSLHNRLQITISFFIVMLLLTGGEINSGFIGDSQSLAGSRKSLNLLHGQPVVMMPHPSANGGHPVGPGFPPPPPPFMQVIEITFCPWKTCALELILIL
jgi:hypothetical protein